MSKLNINISPHIYSPVDTACLMKDVVIALIPAIIASVYFFRLAAVFVISTSVVTCVMTEFILQKLKKRKIKINDYSAVITGILLAMVLPPAIPLWMVVIGGIFAIALGKEIFGGLGCNIFNPALLARAFLMAAFPIALTTWQMPFTLDTVTSATPLGLAKFSHVITSYKDLFIGNVSGSLGETSALAILIGGIYLLYKKVIDYRIPLAYTAVVLIFSGILYTISPERNTPPLFNILAGGFMIGAFFMATDLVTTPVTKIGRLVFGSGCGVITIIIRIWGGLPEGVMYSILVMNSVTPLINKVTKGHRYGATGK
ncbi:RnfABCDGE type electron transport complex subunit D [Candidatus Omnitrophus magneticus]|uniref:Ion-translocating oxidoreductase complex subunit D n=1 Tax=Candidatus Omnitrophus magneticus TaxID=1609969 RepID=A0A0F0CTZ0_9BACT|nr:RnfABCDGE type electron transport complex subunit D [Candidatus Omnitrophus magneticus]